jgi:predicted nucleotidyltransferase
LTTLIDNLRAALEPRAEILEAYLFGSSARGQAAAHSDIDVAVYLSEDAASARVPFGYDSQLAAELMRALRAPRVDVVVLNSAPPVLYHRVLRDGERVLARDLAATTTREGRALSRYCDYVPQLKKIDEALGRRIRSGEFGR